MTEPWYYDYTPLWIMGSFVAVSTGFIVFLLYIFRK